MSPAHATMREHRRAPMRTSVLAIITTVLTAALPACGHDTTPITLGMAAPLQESYGQSAQHGVQLAIDEVNASGGVNGRQLVARFADDSGNGTTAARVAESFVQDPAVIGVIGHVTSVAMVAATRVYDAGHLAAVATSVTTPELSGASPWIFRMIPNDSMNGSTLARFATSRGTHRALVLYENDSYGRGLAQGFARAFGGTVIALEPISGDAPQVEEAMQAYQRNEPDVIVGIGTEHSGHEMLRIGRQLYPNAIFLGGDGWTAIGTGTTVAEGAFVSVPFTALDTRPAARHFINAYRARFHGDPDGDAALGYDATEAMVEAIRAGGATRDGVRDALTALGHDRPVNGVSGPLGFESTGDPAGRSLEITRVEKGQLVPFGS